MDFLRLCWRDVWRNPRRSILTGLVMVFSVAMMILFVGVSDGSHRQMIEAATDTVLGHLQVQPEGYRDEPDLDHRVKPAELARLADMLDGDTRVKAWAPRLLTGGLVSPKAPIDDDGDTPTDMTSEGAVVLGVQPDRERTVGVLARSVLPDDPQGRCLRGCRKAVPGDPEARDRRCGTACANAATEFSGPTCQSLALELCGGPCPAPNAAEGADDDCLADDCRERFADYCEPARFLSDVTPEPDQPWRGEAVLGVGLAQVLEVGVGDRVALSSGTAQGRTFASLYRVAGLLRTGATDINRAFLLTHLDKLSSGFDLPGAASLLVVATNHADAADEVAAALDAQLREQLPGLRAWSWRELSPELYLLILLDAASMLVTLVLLVMVVGIILTNVVTMSVMERTREYGVRLALGEAPARLAWGLVTEILLLALGACALGALLGEGGNWALSVYGLDLGVGEIEVAGVLGASQIYTEVTLAGLLFSVGTVLGFSMLGTLYPAWRIHRLSPVVALRFT